MEVSCPGHSNERRGSNEEYKDAVFGRRAVWGVDTRRGCPLVSNVRVCGFSPVAEVRFASDGPPMWRF